MKIFDYYITLIFLVKFIFLLLSIYYVYLKAKGKQDTPKGKSILFWKDHIEFIFTALMSVLLIYLFNPRTDKATLVDKETKLLLYLFGFVLIITANWKLFLGESPLLNKIQEIVGH